MAGGMIFSMVDVNDFVDKMFLQADKDNNKMISFDEFKKYIKEHHDNKSF